MMMSTDRQNLLWLLAVARADRYWHWQDEYYVELLDQIIESLELTETEKLYYEDLIRQSDELWQIRNNNK